MLPASAVPLLQRAPMAAGQMLLALDRYLGPSHELVLVGDLGHHDTKQAIVAVHKHYLPRSVVAARDSRTTPDQATRCTQLDEAFAGKKSANGKPALYVCQNFACQGPAEGLAAIESTIANLK